MIALLGGEVKSLSHGPCLLIGNIAVRKGLVTKFQVLWSALLTLVHKLGGNLIDLMDYLNKPIDYSPAPRG